MGPARLIPDRQRAAGVEAQKLIKDLKEQTTDAALAATMRLEELRGLASFQGDSGSTADALYAQAVVRMYGALMGGSTSLQLLG